MLFNIVISFYAQYLPVEGGESGFQRHQHIVLATRLWII